MTREERRALFPDAVSMLADFAAYEKEHGTGEGAEVGAMTAGNFEYGEKLTGVIVKPVYST